MKQYNNTKILVCCHKDDIKATEEPYLPIHVGKELSNCDLNIATDNTGNNISIKNNSYCELTGVYWAWKNLIDTEIVGLCHYRRYFDFHQQCQPIKPYTIFQTSYFSNLNLSIPPQIIKSVKEGLIILPRRESFAISAMDQYNAGHYNSDLSIVNNIIKELYGIKYSRAIWKSLVNNNKISLANMFIMNWENFNAYCNWLFPVLFRAEEVINFDNYPPYQKRVFGFIAERLLNVWVYAENKKVKRFPIILLANQNDKMSQTPVWKYSMGYLLNEVIHLCQKIEYKFALMPNLNKL